MSFFYENIENEVYNQQVYNATLSHMPTVSRLESVLQIVDVFSHHHCPVWSLTQSNAACRCAPTCSHQIHAVGCWAKIKKYFSLDSLQKWREKDTKFNKGGLSNFVSYFLKVSIFRASLELFKTTRNFDLSERAWDDIAIFSLFWVFFFVKGGLFNFIPYFLKVSICWASQDPFLADWNFDRSERAWDEIAIFTLFKSLRGVFHPWY